LFDLFDDLEGLAHIAEANGFRVERIDKPTA